MAFNLDVAEISKADTDSSPLKRWYLDQFTKYLPAIRASELLTTYFSTSYGELYEYGAEFIRVLHLINETADQESISGEARRMGWKWYRLANERDYQVRRELDGKWVRLTEDETNEAADLDEKMKSIQETRWSEQVKRQHAREVASAAENLLDITTGRLGEVTRTTKSIGTILPCYLFHVRYPNDCGDDLWTAQSFLTGLGNQRGEEAIHWVCFQLLDLGGRVKAMLRQTEAVLNNPNLLRADIDQRRKTRSIDLEAVNAHSSATSVGIAAASEFRKVLMGTSENVR